MFHFAQKALLLAATLCATAAAAAPRATVDFVPQSISYQSGLDDDVSGSRSQHVTLKIKNVGNTASRYPGSIMRLLVNGAVVNGNVYGSNGVGGYNLHAPIRPGQVGLVLFYFPLNTLRHCRNVVVEVDADRTYQYGGNVFANDRKTLLGSDPTNIRACIPGGIGGFSE